jgi:hypothetical protein
LQPRQERGKLGIDEYSILVIITFIGLALRENDDRGCLLYYCGYGSEGHVHLTRHMAPESISRHFLSAKPMNAIITIIHLYTSIPSLPFLALAAALEVLITWLKDASLQAN